jgi:hypothetical protein
VPQSRLIQGPSFLAKQRFASFSIFQISKEVNNSLELSFQFLGQGNTSTDPALVVLPTIFVYVFVAHARAAQGSFDKFNVFLTGNEKGITKSRHESPKHTMSLGQDTSKAQKDVLNILFDPLVKISVVFWILFHVSKTAISRIHWLCTSSAIVGVIIGRRSRDRNHLGYD